MSRVMTKPVFGISNTNQAVQPQKMAKDLKFPIQEEEGFYYLSSENNGTFVFQYMQSAKCFFMWLLH